MLRKFIKRTWIIKSSSILEINNAEGHDGYVYSRLEEFFDKLEIEDIKDKSDVFLLLLKKGYMKASYNQLPHIQFYDITCFNLNDQKVHIKNFLNYLLDEDLLNLSKGLFISNQLLSGSIQQIETTVEEFLSD